MRSVLFPAAFALATAIFLFGLVAVAPSPVLYAPDNGSSTDDHFNPAALKHGAQEREGEVIEAMGDLLDATGTVTLYLSSDDIPASEEELRAYLDGMEDLRGLVIQLDMEESDLDAFLECNRKNLEYLSGLKNATERYDELKRLEIQWNDPANPYEITSRVYEGEALCRKIRDLSDRYASQKPQLLNISDRFELDTTLYLQSVEDVAAIAEKADRYQEEQREAASRQISGAGGSAVSLEDRPLISLTVSPETAVYRDVVLISGRHTGPVHANRPIGIFIDGAEAITTETDAEGRFSVPFLIEQIPAGVHTIYATDYLHHSDMGSLQVVAEDTVLDLTLLREDDTRLVTFLVSLRTVTGTPVRNATVDMYVLSFPAGTITTNESGWYERAFYLWYPTTYSYQAKFDPGSLPLNPSESDVCEIVIENMLTPRLTTTLWTVCLVAAISLGGALFLRRSRRRPVRSHDEVRDEAPEEPLPPDEDPPVVVADTAVCTTPPPFAPSGEGREAVHWWFLQLRDEAGRALGMEKSDILTPREVLLLLHGRVPESDLKAFVAAHERHVYGRIPVSDGEYASITELFDSVTAHLRGDRH
ncbi:MAG: hypothetical protein PHX88_01485 [Methanoculleus horonobensis]|nr:hypothetical protein [Methanoculleus horonobensis]MDD4251523.1 hypothetical protein [Methanoculleus horonobensis]